MNRMGNSMIRDFLNGNLVFGDKTVYYVQHLYRATVGPRKNLIMANVSECSNSTSNGDGFPSTKFWIGLFTRDVTALLGIIGNIMILVILRQKQICNTFNKLRMALALSDTIMLITCLTASILQSSKDVLGIMYPVLLWPMRNIAMTTSAFITVSIALERHKAINDPLKYRSNKRHEAQKYVYSALVASVLLNIHLFFELENAPCNDGLPGLYFGSVNTSQLFEDEKFTIYNTIIVKLLITGLIPILLLIVLYAKIYCKMKVHRTNLAHDQCSANKMREESKLAGIFAGVVITSLICIIPDLIVKIQTLALHYELNNDWDFKSRTHIREIRDVFTVLNSSVNIVIYNCLGEDFRKFFSHLFNCTGKPLKETKANNSLL